MTSLNAQLLADTDAVLDELITTARAVLAVSPDPADAVAAIAHIFYADDRDGGRACVLVAAALVRLARGGAT